MNALTELDERYSSISSMSHRELLSYYGYSSPGWLGKGLASAISAGLRALGSGYPLGADDLAMLLGRGDRISRHHPELEAAVGVLVAELERESSLLNALPRLTAPEAEQKSQSRRKMMLVSDNPSHPTEAICVTGTRSSIIQAARRMATRTGGASPFPRSSGSTTGRAARTVPESPPVPRAWTGPQGTEAKPRIVTRHDTRGSTSAASSSRRPSGASWSARLTSTKRCSRRGPRRSIQ